MSQNLMKMLNIRRNSKEQGWTFQGTIDENTVGSFCKEERILFRDIIKIKATTEMLYKHRLLFDIWDL